MDKSSQACFLCGVTSKDMNKPHVIVKKIIDEKAPTFGLSPLHARIRFIECVLLIAYRLPIEVWRVTGQEKKNYCL